MTELLTTIKVLCSLFIKEAAEFQDPTIQTVVSMMTAYLEPAVVDQEPAPAVVYQEPDVVYQEPTVVDQVPVVVYLEPDVVYQEPAVVDQVPAVVYQEPAVVDQEPAVVEEEEDNYLQPLHEDDLDLLVTSMDNLSISLIESTPQPPQRTRRTLPPPMSPPPVEVPAAEPEPNVIITNQPAEEAADQSAEAVGFSMGGLLHGRVQSSIVERVIMLGQRSRQERVPVVHIEHAVHVANHDLNQIDERLLLAEPAVIIQEREKIRERRERVHARQAQILKDLRTWQKKEHRGKWKK